MDLSQTLDFNTILPSPFSGAKFIDLDLVFGKIYYFFGNLFNPLLPTTNLGTIVKFILAVFSIFFIFIITYCFVRLLEIRKKEHAYYHRGIEAYRQHRAEEERKALSKSGSLNQRWDTVLQYLFSSSPGDWKLAVLEADTLLEDLLDQMGFKGENLGEKLKSADQDKLKYLSAAWEAHNVRNKIAHEGQQFDLSQREAKRVIALYEQIFRNYGFI
jgi:hypothetical protein